MRYIFEKTVKLTCQGSGQATGKKHLDVRCTLSLINFPDTWIGNSRGENAFLVKVWLFSWEAIGNITAEIKETRHSQKNGTEVNKTELGADIVAECILKQDMEWAWQQLEGG